MKKDGFADVGLLQQENGLYKDQPALAPHLGFAFIRNYHLLKSSRIGDLHSLLSMEAGYF